MILVDGNPLDNISDIRKVSVVSAGKMYQPAALWSVRWDLSRRESANRPLQILLRGQLQSAPIQDGQLDGRSYEIPSPAEPARSRLLKSGARRKMVQLGTQDFSVRNSRRMSSTSSFRPRCTRQPRCWKSTHQPDLWSNNNNASRRGSASCRAGPQRVTMSSPNLVEAALPCACPAFSSLSLSLGKKKALFLSLSHPRGEAGAVPLSRIMPTVDVKPNSTARLPNRRTASPTAFLRRRR